MTHVTQETIKVKQEALAPHGTGADRGERSGKRANEGGAVKVVETQRERERGDMTGWGGET